jgi:hypothetical protein
MAILDQMTKCFWVAHKFIFAQNKKNLVTNYGK